jgi:hypothetical protein
MSENDREICEIDSVWEKRADDKLVVIKQFHHDLPEVTVEVWGESGGNLPLTMSCESFFEEYRRVIKTCVKCFAGINIPKLRPGEDERCMNCGEDWEAKDEIEETAKQLYQAARWASHAAWDKIQDFRREGYRRMAEFHIAQMDKAQEGKRPTVQLERSTGQVLESLVHQVTTLYEELGDLPRSVVTALEVAQERIKVLKTKNLLPAPLTDPERKELELGRRVIFKLSKNLAELGETSVEEGLDALLEEWQVLRTPLRSLNDEHLAENIWLLDEVARKTRSVETWHDLKPFTRKAFTSFAKAAKGVVMKHLMSEGLVGRKWLLDMLSGMRFPDRGAAYDYMKRAMNDDPIKGMQEPDECPGCRNPDKMHRTGCGAKLPPASPVPLPHVEGCTCNSCQLDHAQVVASKQLIDAAEKIKAALGSEQPVEEKDTWPHLDKNPPQWKKREKKHQVTVQDQSEP